MENIENEPQHHCCRENADYLHHLLLPRRGADDVACFEILHIVAADSRRTADHRAYKDRPGGAGGRAGSKEGEEQERGEKDGGDGDAGDGVV